MKGRSLSKTSIFITILIIFIVGQIMGAAAIKYFFIQYKIQELEPQVNYIANEVENNIKISKRKDFIIKAYDIYGNELNVFNDKVSPEITFLDNGINPVLISYIPKIIAGKSVANFPKVKGLPSQSVVIGKPIIQENKIIGAVFLIKPANEFKAALNGFYLVFFITIIMGTIVIMLFISLYLKETKCLEQTRRDYIANISHELKSPISSIKALTETLSDHVVSDDSTKDRYYGIILKESARLEKLISDMLELSRLQSRKLVFSKDEINTENMIKTVEQKYSLIADDMDINFSVTENTKELPNIYSNEDRILQVLNILIDNAIKFTPENGQVTIDSTYNDSEITLMVMDNGIGIETDVLPFVFERFYKGNKSHNTGGSGLGLSIAKEIIENLGEKIYVESEYGKGTIFFVKIRRT